MSTMRDVATITVIQDEDSHEYFGRIERDGVSLTTGPWKTLDAMMHHVAGHLALKRLCGAEVQHERVGE